MESRHRLSTPRIGRRRTSPLCIGLVCLLGLVGLRAGAAGAAPSPSAAEPRYAGRPLASALLDLRARGLRLVYTSRVVRPEMRVEREPEGDDPRLVLDQLLAAHGLAARSGPHGLLVIVPRPAPSQPQPSSPPSGEPLPTFHEEIVVTPSQFSFFGLKPASRLGLSRKEIEALPHLGDDLARALEIVPGLATNDVSARFQVRGGWRDETGIVLDGQELLDPFHLRDLDGALLIVAPGILSGAEISTGTVSASYGGRLGGILEMSSAAPSGPAHGRIGLGILGAQVAGSGALPHRLGGWMAEARRGTGELLGRLLKTENPEYWDLFGKAELDLGARHDLRANLLLSTDRLSFARVEDGRPKRWLTDYDDSYLWLTHQALLGSTALLASAASTTRLHRDRGGREEDEDASFAVRDRRESTVRELRQDWSFAVGDRHEVRAGWELRDDVTEYDYSAIRRDDSPLARIRHDFGRPSTRFAGSFQAHDGALYLSDTLRPRPALSLDLGLRYDRLPLAGDEPWSPRLNLAYGLGARGVVRLGWGRFHQSQRTTELQVEDGETTFHRGERAEEWVLGIERTPAASGPFRSLSLRLELYQRRVTGPRPRYVNLFEPLNVFPEIEPDRVRLAPTSSAAQGAEVYLHGALGDRATASVGYTWAETTDRLAGRAVPRPFDQRQAIHLDLDLPAGSHWRLNFAWRYHSGWPTTPLSLRRATDEEGEAEWVPQLGPLDSRRLPPYHRLDLRASRRFKLRRSTLELYFDVQNLYDRRNVGGFDYQIDEERGALVRRPEPWPGILPSFGVTLEL